MVRLDDDEELVALQIHDGSLGDSKGVIEGSRSQTDASELAEPEEVVRVGEEGGNNQ